MNDYAISIDLKSGGLRHTTYQNLLRVLGLLDEDYLGNPLKEGTLSQLRYVLVVLKGGFLQIERVRAYNEKGEEVAAFGIENL
jgi:hypothetical protein